MTRGQQGSCRVKETRREVALVNSLRPAVLRCLIWAIYVVIYMWGPSGWRKPGRWCIVGAIEGRDVGGVLRMMGSRRRRGSGSGLR